MRICHWFLLIDFSMPVTFQMVPLKVSTLDVDGAKTYFFKVNKRTNEDLGLLLTLSFTYWQARIPNNKFAHVRLRLSRKGESRDDHVAVESHASGNIDEEITKIF